MLFDILEPHANHGVSVELVELGIFSAEGKWLPLLIFLEEIWEGFLFYGMDFIQREPTCKCGKGEVRRRLDNGAGHESVLLRAKTRLRD